MEKVKKKFNFLKFITFLLVIGLLCFLIYQAFKIKTKNIIVQGNNYYNDEIIIETAKIENYPRFLLLSSSSIEKKLLKLDLIEEVDVIKKYNFTIEINVKEKEILYLVRSTNLYKLSTGENIELDHIIGTPIAINYIPENIEKEFVEKFSKIDKNVRVKVSEIEYSMDEYDDERFLLYMNDGNEVYITLSKMENLNKYIEIAKELDGKNGILYLDSGNYFEIKEK